MFRLQSAVLPLFVTCAIGIGSLASAAEMVGADLAKARTCLACHQIDSKRVGPAYQSVAQRYAATPDALAKLQHSIRNGSANKWGKVPMPAQTQVSAADAEQLARWILSLKK